jgi:aminoglycoside phosphotransferase (APT) family kinase protein
MRTTFHLVIPDRSRGQILLVENGKAWSLPRASGNESTSVSDVGRTIHEQVGLEVFVLRSALDEGIDQPDGAVFMVTENLTDRAPTAGHWWDEDALHVIEISDPRDRTAALAWFNEVRDGIPTHLQPWQREGWLAAVSVWLRSVVTGVTAITQHATWCNSCVLRVETSGEAFYLKASPGYFLREGEVTAMLGRLFPVAVPRVVALERSRGWVLLEDLGDALVSALDLDSWADAVDAIASLHRRSIPVVQQLIQGGCVDRRPLVLATQIEALANDTVVALPDGLRPRLQDAMGRLQELCAELEGSPFPSTLVHGDLHADNIMRTERGYVLFDWTDACVALPFVDLITFVGNFGPASDDPVLREALRDRYLDAWGDVVPRAEAIDWFERAEPLAAMHQAVTYRGIYDAFGSAEWSQFSGALPRWIERALSSPSLQAPQA